MFKQKEYKMLGVVFLLGVISAVLHQPKIDNVTHNRKSDVIQMSLEQIHKEALSLLDTGKQMSKLRSSDDLNDIGRCGEMMRKHQAHVKQLRASNNLHGQTSNKVHLGAALITLNLCVSCSKTLADQNCKQAEESLEKI